MNRRNIVILTGLGAAALFAGGAFVYSRSGGEAAAPVLTTQDGLVRAHSPVIGPDNATVTIVEFFDPACESCRAFYPYVKQILANYPYQVRLVLRFAAFHKGSDVAVGMLEGARKQGKFEAVLEALLAKQPEWAMHGALDLDRAWAIAGEAGLDVAQARKDVTAADLARLLEQDMQDVRALQVTGTPTFFVNGKKPEAFGPDALLKLVQSEIAAAK
jgi:protein-disulfide isomerase